MLKKLIKTVLWACVASVGGAALILAIAYFLPDDPEGTCGQANPVIHNHQKLLTPRTVSA